MGVLISDDKAGGFYTTQATIVAQREKYFYIDRPFAHDYNPLRGGCVTALHSLVDGHGVRDASVENSGSVRYYLQNNTIEDNGSCGIFIACGSRIRCAKKYNFA